VPFEKKRGINTVTQTQTKLGSDLRDLTGPSAKTDSRGTIRQISQVRPAIEPSYSRMASIENPNRRSVE
jgi:hypothetical protein